MGPHEGDCKGGSTTFAAPVRNVVGKVTAGAELAGRNGLALQLDYDADIGGSCFAQAGSLRLAVHC